MFNRTILKRLELWAASDNRKPLVLRGARQTGKTTIVNMFAKRFNQYIYLNLDLPEDRNLFAKDYPFGELLEAIFFLKGKKQNIEKTLIFIDEIQQEPKAVAYLRYFYEQAKSLFVIAAGSLLESLLNRHISFPVGRTDYLIMRPASFEEFLEAIGEPEAAKMLNTVPIPAFAQEKLFKLFHRYALIGGMPEIVQRYAQTNDLTTLKPIYESLITAYLDDVEKYAPSDTQARVIRHVIKSAFFEAGTRIKFEGFGKSNYKSREVSESLQLLEKAFLLYLVYPTTAIEPPLIPDRKKSPKLQFLDTGLINYFAGLQQEIFGSKNLNALFGGKIVEHIVGQELLAQQDSLLHGLIFWVRQKKQSNAEIDFLLTYENKAIPVEVKSGPVGRLRSLHLFMDKVHHGLAVRLHAGNLQIDKIKTIGGTDFYLLSLPYFLAGKLESYLGWFVKKN